MALGGRLSTPFANPSPASGPRHASLSKRRGVASATTVGLSVAAVLIATFTLREGGSSVAASRAASDVARVICESDGAVVDAPAVRVGDAGVRFVVQNASQAEFLRVRPDREVGRPIELLLTAGSPVPAPTNRRGCPGHRSPSLPGMVPWWFRLHRRSGSAGASALGSR